MSYFTKRTGKLVGIKKVVEGQGCADLYFNGFYVRVVRNLGYHSIDPVRVWIHRAPGEDSLFNYEIYDGLSHLYHSLELLSRFMVCINYLESTGRLGYNLNDVNWKTSYEKGDWHSRNDCGTGDIRLYINDKTIIELYYIEKLFFGRKHWELTIGDECLQIIGFKEKDLPKFYNFLEDFFERKDYSPSLDEALLKIPSYTGDLKGQIGRIKWEISVDDSEHFLYVEYPTGQGISNKEIILRKDTAPEFIGDLDVSLGKIMIFDWLCRTIEKLSGPEISLSYNILSPSWTTTGDDLRIWRIYNSSNGKRDWEKVCIIDYEDNRKDIHVSRWNLGAGKSRRIPGNPLVQTIPLDAKRLEDFKEKLVKELEL